MGAFFSRFSRWVVLSLAFLLTTLAAAPAVEAAKCVKPGGKGGCFASIQAAVDASLAGGTVNVYPGTYNETVAIATPGIKLVGVGKTPDQVRIDGLRLAANGIFVEAPNVVLRNLAVRNTGGRGVLVTGTGSGLFMNRVHVTNTGQEGVRIEAPGAQLLSCRVTGSLGYGIDIERENALVSRCILRKGPGLYFGSDSGRVIATTVDMTTAGANGGIYGYGDLLVVRGCVVRNAATYGIQIEGSGIGGSSLAPLVTGNNVSVTGGSGIMVILRGAGTVIGNTVRDAAYGGGGAGYEIVCRDNCGGAMVVRNLASRTAEDRPGFNINSTGVDGLLVQYNRALDCGGSGFTLSGASIEVRDNVARGCGMSTGMSGFTVVSYGALLEDNLAQDNVGVGFELRLDSLVIRRNRAEGNTLHGFQLGDAGTTDNALMDGNTAVRNLGLGIRLGVNAGFTTVQSNAANGNADFDFCDDGYSTSLSGNSFGKVCP